MKRKFRVCIALALTVAMMATTAVAVTAAYDTKNDPIVVYSGLQKWAEETFRPSINQTIEQSVSPLQSELNSALAKLSAAEQTIAHLEQSINALSDKLNSVAAGGGSSTANNFTVIYLTGGTQLLATSVCSIILRAGSAEVVSPFVGDSAQGLSDITEGVELYNGTPLPLNHEVIVPRGNDGRGIRITSSSGAYILVQGGYTLVEP